MKQFRWIDKMGMLGASLLLSSDNQAASAFVKQDGKIPFPAQDQSLEFRRNLSPSFLYHSLPAAKSTTILCVAKEDTNEVSGTNTDSLSLPDEPLSRIGVVAPLHRIGPYICLRLHFPDWKDQDKENKPSYEFMIDTGANVNSIDARLVENYGLAEYTLPSNPRNDGDVDDKLDSIIPSSSLIGATTSKSDDENPSMGGLLHMLGNCQLAGLPPPPMIFLRNLVAAALPFASPVGVGLLGLPFLWTFPAGVEFDWHGTDGDPPTIIFYYGKDPPIEAAKMDKMVRCPLKALLGGLMTLEISINNVNMRALLDTGSPLTVLNEPACKLLGVDEAEEDGDEVMGVKIVGVDGSQSELRRLNKDVSVQVSSDNTKTTVSLGRGHVWSGTLAGIELIGRLGDNMGPDEPAAVLGLDFLRNSYRMILRAPSEEVWFEELPDDVERIYG
jgi:hypothetical protein